VVSLLDSTPEKVAFWTLRAVLGGVEDEVVLS
jgi:hypothetical protein